MTVLSKIERSVVPPRIVTLTPSAFSDDWSGKPAVNVAIGLRFVSQGDLGLARREAEREAVGFYEELRGAPRTPDLDTMVDIRNDALLIGAVARAACDPTDVTKPYFKGAEGTVRIALTPAGLRRLWDELVILLAGSTVARPSATDDDVVELARRLRTKPKLDDEARKLIAYLLEIVQEGSEESMSDDEPLDEEDGPRVVYHARSASP